MVGVIGEGGGVLQADEWNWNRGALAMYYGGYSWQQSGPANNGNVTAAQHWIPTNDQISSYNYTEERYLYDSLNRLSSITEYHATPSGLVGPDFAQVYDFDRYGNRTINAAQSWGGVNEQQFTVNSASANNRLGVPGGQSGAMSYDAAGNLTSDTYTGAGARVYDAENRMTKAWGGNNQWQEYSYNADGQRVRRKIDGTETWQIYGIEGELLAEYAASGAVASPQKEYGYRNRQLLITADAREDSGARINVALAANGGWATASSVHASCNCAAATTNNGDRKGDSTKEAGMMPPG